MKIKTKKQLNLPQLIEWAWDNGIDSRTFTSPKGGDITFDEYGDVVGVYSINLNDTFTVEIEEEIDEDTELDKLVVIDDDDDLLVFSNYTIREIKNNDFKEYHAYIDGEFKLIWTNEKGLVV